MKVQFHHGKDVIIRKDVEKVQQVKSSDQHRLATDRGHEGKQHSDTGGVKVNKLVRNFEFLIESWFDAMYNSESQ